MKRRGSSEPGFQSIVAAGSAVVAALSPADSKVAANKPLLIDWGAGLQGLPLGHDADFHHGQVACRSRRFSRSSSKPSSCPRPRLAPGKMTTEIDRITQAHCQGRICRVLRSWPWTWTGAEWSRRTATHEHARGREARNRHGRDHRTESHSQRARAACESRTTMQSRRRVP